MADDPVYREPVSAPNSLITGKNTGNFAEFGTSLALEYPNSGRAIGISEQIRSASEQGIFEPKTGKEKVRTGNLERATHTHFVAGDCLAHWLRSPLEDRGEPLPPAYTHGLQPVPRTSTFHFIRERRQNADSRRGHRMSK